MIAQEPEDPSPGRPLANLFRELDPSRDEAAWSEAIARVVARSRARPNSFASGLVSAGRYALALAAGAALVVWIPLAVGSAEPSGAPREEPTTLRSYLEGQPISPLDLLPLGGRDDA